jgi:hypothetical protein
VSKTLSYIFKIFVAAASVAGPSTFAQFPPGWSSKISSALRHWLLSAIRLYICSGHLSCTRSCLLTRSRQKDMNVVALGLVQSPSTVVEFDYHLSEAHLEEIERPDDV